MPRKAIRVISLRARCAVAGSTTAPAMSKSPVHQHLLHEDTHCLKMRGWQWIESNPAFIQLLQRRIDDILGSRHVDSFRNSTAHTAYNLERVGVAQWFVHNGTLHVLARLLTRSSLG